MIVPWFQFAISKLGFDGTLSPLNLKYSPFVLTSRIIRYFFFTLRYEGINQRNRKCWDECGRQICIRQPYLTKKTIRNFFYHESVLDGQILQCWRRSFISKKTIHKILPLFKSNFTFRDTTCDLCRSEDRYSQFCL